MSAVVVVATSVPNVVVQRLINYDEDRPDVSSRVCRHVGWVKIVNRVELVLT